MSRIKRIPAKRQGISRRTLFRSAGLIAAGAAIPGFWSAETVQVRRHTIFLPKWDAEGFRVVQFSDIHTINEGLSNRARRAIELAIAENPDLLVCTGDYMNRESQQQYKLLRHALEPLHDASCPVYGVFGNHDCMCDQRSLNRGLQGSNLTILRNESVEVNGVSLVGIDDAIYNRQSLGFVQDGDFSRSLLALWHEPDFVVELPEHVSLQLSGHSHGGEICLPGGVPLHTPFGAKKYISGFYPDAQAPLYVSKGVATLAPFRLYCPPEINVLTIRSSDGGPARIEA